MISIILKKIEEIELPDLETLITTLTAILLIKHCPGDWYARGPITVLCILILVFPKLRKHSTMWLLIASFLGAVILNRWFELDNHKYLELYVVLTLGIVFSFPAHLRTRMLQVNSSLLLGGCMFLAVLWKLVSKDYMSGDFFEFTLLIDSRFEAFAAFLGGLPDEIFRQNRMTYSSYEDTMPGSGFLESSTRMNLLAQFLTWWTVFIEGSIALLFLLAPLKNKLGENCRKFGLWILLAFAVSTYAVATVKGFAWLLLVLGLGQTKDSEKLLRIAIIAVFLLIQIYTLPYGEVFEAVRR